jgi:mono/diheme cytochrome c family protein
MTRVAAIDAGASTERLPASRASLATAPRRPAIPAMPQARPARGLARTGQAPPSAAMSRFQILCVAGFVGVLALLIGIVFAMTPAPPPPAAVEPDEGHLRALARDPAVVAAGAALFPKYCAACHGPKGQGALGPNLRDDHWLHGSDMTALVTSIRDGYPARGMAAWGGYYSPDEIHDLAAFVASLHGTDDGTGKAPEGPLAPILYLAAPATAAASATTSVTAPSGATGSASAPQVRSP